MPAQKKIRMRLERYVDFLNSIRIDVELLALCIKRYPDPIKRDRYPEPVFRRDPNFDSFVAFDLETTGLTSKFNSIIEIGAIKVIGGAVVESVECIF